MRSRSVEILVAAVVLFVFNYPVLATIHFKDGGIHDIDYEINDDVWVDYESPGLGTTLNILDGATIASRYDVRAWEDSIINILGGSMNRLIARDSSQVTVSGGLMSGAARSHALWACDSSQVTVSGGSINGLVAYHNNQVTVSGGSIGGRLSVWGNSQVTVSGGLFGGELRIGENAVLTIHGWDFAVDGTPVGYTELSSILGGTYRDEPYRQLAGTLLNGDPINNGFLIGNNGKIVLVPEPATLLLLGFGGLALLRKRRL